MSALPVLLFLFSTGCFLYLLFNKPPERKVGTYPAAIQHGKLEAVIQYYEDGAEDNIWPDMCRAIRLWAIGRSDKCYSAELELAFESELHRYFASYRPKVVSLNLTPSTSPEPEVIPAKPTRAERVKAALTSDADTVQEIGDTINELRKTRKDLWDNRMYPGDRKPIGNHLDQKADDLIRIVLHGSNKSW